jgi:hypothetical protein
VAEPEIGGTIHDQSAGVMRPARSSLARWVRNRRDSVWWSAMVTPAASKECSTARLSSTSARSRHSDRSPLVSSPSSRATTGSWS